MSFLRLRRLLGLIAGNLLVLFVLLALMIGAIEVYFRVRYPAPDVSPRRVLDPELGWDTMPAVEPLRNDGHAAPVVAFLGDSFTDGTAWPREAQAAALRSRVPFDGFQLGVSGYGTTQEMLKLQRYMQEEKPDIVVLLLFAWNDLRDNLRAPAVFYSPETIERPALVRSGTGFALQGFHRSWLDSLLMHSEFHRRLTQRWHVVMSSRIAQHSLDTAVEKGWPLLLGYDDVSAWMPFYVLTEQDRPYVREAYAVTEEALRRLRDVAWAQNTRLVVLGIDNAFTVDDDVRRKYFAEQQNIDLDLPLNRLARVAEDLRIRFVSVVPALRSLAKKTHAKVYNGPEGNLSAHLEPEAYRAVGEIAAREIVRIRRLPME